MKKTWNFLMKNLPYKILAIVMAIALWLVVYNIDDPNKVKPYTTAVSITGTEALEDMGKCYVVLDGSDTVTFSVSAKRSYLTNISESDFEAVADMSEMQIQENGTEALVPIRITAKRNASNLKFVNPTKYLHVALENLQTEKYIVQAKADGQVAEGFALKGVTVQNPSVIKVEGPESVVSQIDSVVAAIDVSGMSVNYTDNVRLQYYDAEGNRIDTTRLKFSADKVTVAVEIQATKTVPLKFETTGVPAEGYDVESITSTPENVTIQGESSVLTGITSIDIPSSELNVQGATGSITTNIDITEFLPQGITLVKGAESTVEVTVHIESDTTESYVVKTSNFNLKNVPDGYKVSVTQETVTVRVTGKAADLKNVSAESITGNIDLSGLGEGSHNIPIQFAMDTELYQVSNVSVTVVVEKKTTGETGTGNQNNTPNDNNQETGGSGDNNLNTDTEQNETNSDATGANVTAGAGSIHTRNQ